MARRPNLSMTLTVPHRLGRLERATARDLQGQHGFEPDPFDAPDTGYVVHRSADGGMTGFVRLQPTNKPYQLAQSHGHLFNGLPPPCTREVWELSRLTAPDLHLSAPCIDDTRRSPIAAALLKAALQSALLSGARRAVTLGSLPVERLLQQGGYRVSRAGPPVLQDGQALYACFVVLQD